MGVVNGDETKSPHSSNGELAEGVGGFGGYEMRFRSGSIFLGGQFALLGARVPVVNVAPRGNGFSCILSNGFGRRSSGCELCRLNSDDGAIDSSTDGCVMIREKSKARTVFSGVVVRCSVGADCGYDLIPIDVAAANVDARGSTSERRRVGSGSSNGSVGRAVVKLIVVFDIGDIEKRRRRRFRGNTRFGVVERTIGLEGGVQAAKSAAAASRFTVFNSTSRANTARSSGAAAHKSSHVSIPEVEVVCCLWWCEQQGGGGAICWGFGVIGRDNVAVKSERRDVS